MYKYVCISKCPCNSKPCEFTEQEYKDCYDKGNYFCPMHYSNKVKKIEEK